MDHQRPPGRLQHIEQRSDQRIAGLIDEYVGGKLETNEAPLELALERRRIDPREACRRPTTKRPFELCDSIVVGGQERESLARGKQLDAQGRRQRNEHEVEAIGSRQRRSRCDIVIVGIDRVIRLAVEP